MQPLLTEPTPEEVAASKGALVLEFGATWCPICQNARPLIDRALAQYPDVRHLSIEDGKGKRLGRSFAVKLWPTLIYLTDGREVARVVRPTTLQDVTDGLRKLPSA